MLEEYIEPTDEHFGDKIEESDAEEGTVDGSPVFLDLFVHTKIRKHIVIVILQKTVDLIHICGYSTKPISNGHP